MKKDSACIVGWATVALQKTLNYPPHGRKTLKDRSNERGGGYSELLICPPHTLILCPCRRGGGFFQPQRLEDTMKQEKDLSLPLEGFARLTQITRVLAVSRPTLYKWIQDGKFPPPIKLGRISVWPVDVVRQEISRRGGPVLQAPSAECMRFIDHFIDTDKQLLGAREAYTFLGISRASMYRYIKSGHIPAPQYMGCTPLWQLGNLRRVYDNLPIEPASDRPAGGRRRRLPADKLSPT